ncbi:MAG: VCBS repeat-containing protein [Roseburia sp.]|nr:VCBS repeat-containing protein [Roseburia sp.]
MPDKRIERSFLRLLGLAAGVVVLWSYLASAVWAKSREEELLDRYHAYKERFEQIETIEDITLQGYEILDKHVFDIPLTTWLPERDQDGALIAAEVVRPEDVGEIGSQDAVFIQQVPTVRFFTAIEKDSHRAAVFLADGAGRIIYKCNQLDCNYGVLGKLEQPITDMISVAFQDVNKDELTDIILIAGCQKEEGDYAGKLYKIGEVLFQSPNGQGSLEGLDFYRDYRINDKINRFDMNKNAKCIITFVRDGCSAEFLYTATTEQELTENGFQVFAEQSYWRNYEKLGRLKVLPGRFSMADYDVFMIYMINEQGDIVWSFQPMGDYDNLYSLRGMSGKDMDGDGMKDLVVYARYSNEGENGESIVESKCDIYYQRTGGFDIDTDFAKTYQCTGQETMEELLIRIRAYWGWQEQDSKEAAIAAGKLEKK